MTQRRALFRLSLLLLTLLALSFSKAASADASGEAAARQAVAENGGRVLSVKTEGSRHRVKLLLPSGKVKVVSIPIQVTDQPVGDEGRRPPGAEPRKPDETRSRIESVPVSERGSLWD